MNKKSIKSVFIICLLIMTLCLTSCGNNSPETVTNKFFSALKMGDVDTALECLSPVIQDQYKAGVAIADVFIDCDADALLNAVLGIGSAYTYEDYEFVVSDYYETDEKHAVVSVDVYINDVKDDSGEISCVKYNDKWYIEN